MAAKLMRHSEGQKLLLASLKRNFSPGQEAAAAEEEGFLSFEEVLAGLVTVDGENKKLVLDQVFREFLTRDLLTAAAGSPPDIAACQRFVVQFAIQVSIHHPSIFNIKSIKI